MKRCVIYPRISVTLEESVSLDRQIEAGRKYAEARGWEVVGVFPDDGVSATQNRPEDRAGWRALLDSPLPYDVVIVWKVDRLARKVLDFLHADADLQSRGAGLVAVDDPIDMSTAQGRAFAQMLAVFGEMEAAAISARVAAARSHLIRNGRVVGGTVPYGWKSVRQPGGGYRLVQDPERIGFVRAAAERTLAGHSLYSTLKWLDDAGAVPATWRVPFVVKPWAYSSLDRLIRHPVLAGMTPYNPGNDTKRRGDEVLRGDDGLPVVDESIAIMSVADWRKMIQLVENRPSPQAVPRSQKAVTSSALSGLVFCGDERHDEPPRMWRGTSDGRPGYACPECHMTITNFEDLVIEEFLAQKGTHVRWTYAEEIHEGAAALLPEIEHRLDELDTLIRDAKTRDERANFQQQQADLLDRRDEARAEKPVITIKAEPADIFSRDWARAEDDDERRAILGDALERIVVKRGEIGRPTRAKVLARLDFCWKDPERVGPAPEHESATA